MPLTPAVSAQYAAVAAGGYVSGADWDGNLHVAHASLTFTVAGTGTAKLITLPPGRKIIFPDISRIVCPAGTSGAVLSIGHTAYVTPAGSTVSAGAAAFLSAQSITSALDAALVLPAVGYFVMDSIGSVDIEALVATQNSPAAGEMYLLLVYSVAR